jgi:cytochrome c oxidase accessory protein FixG
VQVCPTGIDIRDGLQYQCIGCALCIDACDSVMNKMGYPPNLISYTSESTLAGGVMHWFRPRIVGYLSVFILMVTLFAYTLVNRTPLEMTVTRDRGELFVKNTNGYIENIYTLHIINMTNATYRYNLSVENLANAQLIGNREPEVRAGEDLHFSIRLKVPPDTAAPLNQVIFFNLEAQTNMELKTKVESRFIRPEL